MKRNVWVRKFDVFLILGSILLVLLLWGRGCSQQQAPGAVAVIEVDGVVVRQLSLNEDTVFSCPELPQVRFEIKEGKAAFTHSDCPDQVCVHTGWLGQAGQYVACLPNRVALHIRAQSGSGGLDAVA